MRSRASFLASRSLLLLLLGCWAALPASQGAAPELVPVPLGVYGDQGALETPFDRRNLDNEHASLLSNAESGSQMHHHGVVSINDVLERHNWDRFPLSCPHADLVFIVPFPRAGELSHPLLQFKQVILFLSKLVHNFDIHPERSRVALVTLGDRPCPLPGSCFLFHESKDMVSLQNHFLRLLTLRFTAPSGVPNLNDAYDFIEKNVYNMGRSIRHAPFGFGRVIVTVALSEVVMARDSVKLHFEHEYGASGLGIPVMRNASAIHFQRLSFNAGPGLYPIRGESTSDLTDAGLVELFRYSLCKLAGVLGAASPQYRNAVKPKLTNRRLAPDDLSFALLMAEPLALCELNVPAGSSVRLSVRTNFTNENYSPSVIRSFGNGYLPSHADTWPPPRMPNGTAATLLVVELLLNPSNSRFGLSLWASAGPPEPQPDIFSERDALSPFKRLVIEERGLWSSLSVVAHGSPGESFSGVLRVARCHADEPGCVPSSSQYPRCNADVDLAMMMDARDTLNRAEYYDSYSAFMELTEQVQLPMVMNSPHGARVALQTGVERHSFRRLSRYSRGSVLRTMAGIRWKMPQTPDSLADQLRTHFKRVWTEDAGMRPRDARSHVPRILVLATDGRADHDQEWVRVIEENVKRLDIHVFFYVIGSPVRWTVLEKALADHPERLVDSAVQLGDAVRRFLCP